MGISVQTFKNYITSVYAKLDVTNVIEALRAVGWLRLPSEEALAAERIEQATLIAAEDLRDALERFMASASVSRTRVVA